VQRSTLDVRSLKVKDACDRSQIRRLSGGIILDHLGSSSFSSLYLNVHVLYSYSSKVPPVYVVTDFNTPILGPM